MASKPPAPTGRRKGGFPPGSRTDPKWRADSPEMKILLRELARGATLLDATGAAGLSYQIMKNRLWAGRRLTAGVVNRALALAVDMARADFRSKVTRGALKSAMQAGNAAAMEHILAAKHAAEEAELGPDDPAPLDRLAHLEEMLAAARRQRIEAERLGKSTAARDCLRDEERLAEKIRMVRAQRESGAVPSPAPTAGRPKGAPPPIPAPVEVPAEPPPTSADPAQPRDLRIVQDLLHAALLNADSSDMPGLVRAWFLVRSGGDAVGAGAGALGMTAVPPPALETERLRQARRTGDPMTVLRAVRDDGQEIAAIADALLGMDDEVPVGSEPGAEPDEEAEEEGADEVPDAPGVIPLHPARGA